MTQANKNLTDLAQSIVEVIDPRANFPEQFTGLALHYVQAESQEQKDRALHFIDIVFLGEKAEKVFEKKLKPFIRADGNLLALSKEVDTLAQEKQIREKIFEINQDEPNFLFGFNKIFLNYDTAESQDQKEAIMLTGEDYCDHYAEHAFFVKTIRPFLENAKSVSDFCMKTTDIAVENLAQKRRLAN